MDLGEIFTQSIDIQPCAEGTFVVRVGSTDYGRIAGATFGFTCITDLMRWLKDHSEAFRSERFTGSPLPKCDPDGVHDGVVVVPAGTLAAAAKRW